ncbi:follicle-stimulating hormone receptor [Nephila pilipes]|uniref:Follicle-stimulating hormone receptor n=1 Tax=Nephila pilipes TaxID=299642 RepID=A0A8X6QCS3_NEPPI|nr:follicle-stimulating hormone receptor [Nephila pilipes]
MDFTLKIPSKPEISFPMQIFLDKKFLRDLSETSINYLPTKGLEELEVLRLSDVYPLKVFPSVYHFKYIKEAHLTYPYHCCAFKFPATHDPEEFSKYVAFRENVQKMYCNQNPSTTTPMSTTEKSKDNTELRKREGLFVRKQQWINLVDETDTVSSQTESSLELANFWGKHHKRHPKEHIYTTMSNGEIIHLKKSMPIKTKKVIRRRAEWGGVPKPQNTVFYQDYWLNMSDSEDYFGNHLQLKRRKPVLQKNVPDNPFEGVFHGTTVAVISEVELEAFCGQLSKNYRDVECFPSPDAFNPCEDVMGNMLLRVVVWIVVVTSVMGNVAVMVVLMSTGACNSVSKFLMCNLAFADFCMGCYLLMIAAMDLHSIGTYFNYAIDWQHGNVLFFVI